MIAETLGYCNALLNSIPLLQYIQLRQQFRSATLLVLDSIGSQGAGWAVNPPALVPAVRCFTVRERSSKKNACSGHASFQKQQYIRKLIQIGRKRTISKRTKKINDVIINTWHGCHVVAYAPPVKVSSSRTRTARRQVKNNRNSYASMCNR